MRGAVRGRMRDDAKAVVETETSVSRRCGGVESAVHFERMAYVDPLGRIRRDGYMARGVRRCSIAPPWPLCSPL